MRIYLTFFKIVALLSLLNTVSARATYDEAFELATALDHSSQIDLATEILKNVLDTAQHGSIHRAGVIRGNIKRLSMALNSLINPAVDAEKTPSTTKINGPDVTHYGKGKGPDGCSPALFADKENRDQSHAIYVHTVLDLGIDPWDLKGRYIGTLEFIRQNKKNIKKLIKEHMLGRSFYIGRVNAPEGSPQNFGKRCSQHVISLNKASFPNRKVEANQESLNDGYPQYAQPLAINMHPDNVNLIEGHLIHFFPWPSLQNSIKGQTAKKGKKPDEGVALQLRQLYQKFYDEVEKELEPKRDFMLDDDISTVRDLASAFKAVVKVKKPNIFLGPPSEDESDDEPSPKARAGSHLSRLPSDESPSQSVMSRRRSIVDSEPSRLRGKRRNCGRW